MDVAGIFAREFPTIDRHAQLGIAQGRIVSVSFPGTPEDGAESDHELLDRIGAYLEGVEEGFTDVTVAFVVSTDRREVLETVRGIPYGTQAGIETVASMTAGLDPEDSNDRRLVREALRDNPAPLLVPDHRVRDGPSAAPASVAQTFRSVEGL